MTLAEAAGSLMASPGSKSTSLDILERVPQSHQVHRANVMKPPLSREAFRSCKRDIHLSNVVSSALLSIQPSGGRGKESRIDVQMRDAKSGAQVTQTQERPIITTYRPVPCYTSTIHRRTGNVAQGFLPPTFTSRCSMPILPSQGSAFRLPASNFQESAPFPAPCTSLQAMFSSQREHSSISASQSKKPSEKHMCDALLARTKRILERNQDILRELLTAAIQASKSPDTAAAAKLHIRALMHQAAMLQQLKSGAFFTLKASNQMTAAVKPAPLITSEVNPCGSTPRPSKAIPSPSLAGSQNSSCSESGHFMLPNLSSQNSLTSSLSSVLKSPHQSHPSVALVSDPVQPSKRAAPTSSETSMSVSSSMYSHKRDRSNFSSVDQEYCSLLCTESSEMMEFSPVGKRQRPQIMHASGPLPAIFQGANVKIVEGRAGIHEEVGDKREELHLTCWGSPTATLQSWSNSWSRHAEWWRNLDHSNKEGTETNKLLKAIKTSVA
ncbi:hypothetical protein CEUSTIGMA_g2371.t1 [Chlamydomonas eustigma]|uniref:Uncharacterized protein n=1 Tax=Chlamydomonas eustigma TaxID=1157962 RepID=A0A250WVV3_9CHLO|nr:hypothetical protein CEUSTIGMA_g2371.t1 [Chlamydomonas eustigma]|eukprot:GAX74925.1 hypothetical protein CEUSTIGMA_g2371.t1 [Chlamydomonas eustigma]